MIVTGIIHVMAIGTLTLCYNNIQVFRGAVNLMCGLTARIVDETRTISDVYRAFFKFSCLLISKKVCRESGALNNSFAGVSNYPLQTWLPHV
ncbi:hypothetical protein F0562_020519 [Nyssa sinensis]|uniref:Uncharacterized protein n=1 Tax=Nyssa sinensis TaxID=561372 RepID=A0A5J5BVD5_9ASTE|nr:hypothetical protein F0562_020519 [Nyssa sinensis]